MDTTHTNPVEPAIPDNPRGRRPDLDDAIEAALSFAGRLSFDEFMQTRAGRQVVKARQWVCWYAKTYLNETMSLREIGKRLGCSHTTVDSAAATVEAKQSADEKARFRSAVKRVVAEDLGATP